MEKETIERMAEDYSAKAHPMDAFVGYTWRNLQSAAECGYQQGIAEYLQSVWHKGDEKPNDGDVCLIESPFTYSAGNGFFVAYWIDARGYFTRSNTMEAAYLDQVVQWARLEDLTPNKEIEIFGTDGKRGRD